jgi:hypothetical protein
VKLNNVVTKQENEYLNGYNAFISKKERELRTILDKLNEKNSNKSEKDERII